MDGCDLNVEDEFVVVEVPEVDALCLEREEAIVEGVEGEAKEMMDGDGDDKPVNGCFPRCCCKVMVVVEDVASMAASLTLFLGGCGGCLCQWANVVVVVADEVDEQAADAGVWSTNGSLPLLEEALECSLCR